jgi:cytoskeleton protein RodZ
MTAESNPTDFRPEGTADGAGQGVGALLRQARERAGLGLAEVSQRLKMPVHVLEALEGERWERLSAPVFIRGQLRSYARLLKVDVEPFLEQFRNETARQAEPLVSHSHTPHYQWLLQGLARRSLYVVLTLCFIAIPAWLAIRASHQDAAPPTASLDAIPPEKAASPAGAPPAAAPITASLTPLPHATPALSLRVNGDSWVQVVAPDGSTIEQGLIKAGEQRSYGAGQVGRMVIGNASAVEVQHAGSTVDTAPYQRANVARFAVSSDGSLSPVAD